LKLGAACLASALAASAPIAAGADVAGVARDLTDLSLEDLSNIEVTSVSRREEPQADAAAAVAVLTGEDIRRSGAATLAEALRLAPGLHVGQIGSSRWAISARGFSSTSAGQLLVLSDTRSIYTPLFSGVFWDVQDLPLEDVERVEVIRGPGASLWGANAVSGVINITTRSAKETQGAYFEGGGGTTERGFGAVRYGGQLAEHVHFRIFAKGFDRAGEFNPSGAATDGWKLGHLGFRADGELDAKNSFTLQGDVYTGDIGQVVPSVIVTGRPGPTGKLEAGVAGGNLLARWTHAFAPGSDVQVRAYYDVTHRDDPTFLDRLHTIDLDLQHRFLLPLGQDVVWGLHYRSMDDRNRGRGVFALQPPDSRDDLFSGFVQDQIGVLDSLRVTLGTKLEHNDFSGFEYQPTARIAWKPFPDQTLWGAVSRAVRVPTRLERDVHIDATDPAQDPVARLVGSKSFSSERLLAYELGYRWRIEQLLLVDLAAYYDVYRGLASLEADPPFTDPGSGQTVIPVVNKNLTDGVARGGEACLTFSPVRSWRLTASYTFLRLTLDPKGQDLNRGRLLAGATPRHQVGLQSFLDLPGDLQLDLLFRYASSLPSSSQMAPGEDTPAYATLDARVAWKGWQRFELSMVGRNLLQARHREFPGGTEMERAAYAKVAGRF
jgi:iron complex outermembrane receptor protein